MESKVYNQKAIDNNYSNISMDYEKYYKIDNDGYYTLHFLNHHKINVNEIKKIFSMYGKVKAVNTTGDDYGYRFVKYKTLEEVEHCLRGLVNNKLIQLLPEKTKINDLNKLDKKRLSQQQVTTMENSSWRTCSNKQFHLNSADNRKLSESSTHNVQTFNEDNQFKDVENFSDTGSRNSVHSFKSDSLVSNSLSLRQQNSNNSNKVNNSSNKINYEKYYKIAKDGTYIIHFVNKKEFTSEEIKHVFSSYGKVLSVYPNVEKTRGLVHVRYKTLEEIITCLEGLQSKDTICILPQKDKINDIKNDMKTADQRNSNWQSTGTKDSVEETSKQLHSNSNYDKKSSETEEKLICNTTTSQDNTNNFLNTDSLISNSQHLPSSQKNSINCEVSGYNLEQQESNPQSFTKPDTNIYMTKDTFNDDDEMPTLISDTELKQKEFDAMSNSSSQSGTKNASSSVMIIPMQEIIVANIQANYDVHYILHLFKKYNPISATLVKTILETNIRYCHVYFKTIQDAITIEEEFDNFNLAGKNLIVLRISQLIEEATHK
ncbi:uncharacterized protein [Anoplolepis gracilipes]|uniref:uncharacterized protein n=1 Tax=Anoplolepis gracilipes TaxID=354296 RepID=UPI003BA0650A